MRYWGKIIQGFFSKTKKSPIKINDKSENDKVEADEAKPIQSNDDEPKNDVINMEENNNNPIEEQNPWMDLKPLPNNATNVVNVPWAKYYQTKHTKKQIVLHHTVSGPGIEGDLNHWKTFTSHIATCVIIDRTGIINRLFSSAYWGFHLGANNRTLDQQSIAIELDSWGPLIKGNGELYKFSNNKTIRTEINQMYNLYGSKVNVDVVHYPQKFRGYEYYEKYTYEQIRAVGQLLLLWYNTYGIPLTYNEDMWDVSSRALSGTSGVWSHTSYRRPVDKQDVHPQPELIQMLQTLDKIK